MSRGSPMSPSGEPAARDAYTSSRLATSSLPSASRQSAAGMSVGTQPGAMELTRMPCGPASRASVRVSIATAALLRA